MSEHFADRLIEAIRKKNAPVCVGLDPVYDRLPKEITGQAGLGDRADIEQVVDAILEFCRHVVSIVAPIVPAVKINSAFFESLYWYGMEAYYDLVQEAADAGLIVIGDVKRGDVGHSSEHYANAHLSNPRFRDLEELVAPDAVTLSPYFGADALRPFLDACRRRGKGAFVLIQTSNDSAAEVQHAVLSGGMRLCEKLGSLVNTWGAEDGLVGRHGYSSLGAVVSPTDPEATMKLRTIMPRSIFLVPGFGAQGRTIQQVRSCFNVDGGGALVSASRSVLYAFEDPQYREVYGSDWKKCIQVACRDLVNLLKPIHS